MRYETTRHETMRHETTRHKRTRHETMIYETIRHQTTRHETMRHQTTWRKTTRHKTTRHKPNKTQNYKTQNNQTQNDKTPNNETRCWDTHVKTRTVLDEASPYASERAWNEGGILWGVMITHPQWTIIDKGGSGACQAPEIVLIIRQYCKLECYYTMFTREAPVVQW